jgi:hypothetical protein
MHSNAEQLVEAVVEQIASRTPTKLYTQVGEFTSMVTIFTANTPHPTHPA